jgi:hypothetical protein
MGSRGTIVVLLSCLFAGTLLADGNRLWLDAKINGKSARLVLDTGAFDSILYPEAAKILGVKFFARPFADPAEGFEVRLGRTEPFDLTILNFTGRTTFGTYDLAAAGVNVPGDGIYGWKDIKTNIILIDAAALSVTILDRIPEDARGWTKLAVAPNETLCLEVPGELWTIAVDTGSPSGLSLRPQQWREWKATHTNAALTVDWSHIISGGFSINEEAFARELSIGGLRLTDVPIRQPTAREVAELEVVFGLAALARVDFIVDGKQGYAYLRPRRTPAAPYGHNRLGAVFAPRHARSQEMLAHVVDGGPAHLAGIRNGDLLLRIGNSVVKKWALDGVPLYKFWESPPCTKLDLTVKRGDEILNFSVVLQEILAP